MKLFGWFRKPEATPENLKPGECECGHGRCYHIRGTGPCTVWNPPDEEYKDGGNCACEIYIRDDDNDNGDDDAPAPVDPEVAELSRMSKL